MPCTWERGIRQVAFWIITHSSCMLMVRFLMETINSYIKVAVPDSFSTLSCVLSCWLKEQNGEGLCLWKIFCRYAKFSLSYLSYVLISYWKKTYVFPYVLHLRELLLPDQDFIYLHHSFSPRWVRIVRGLVEKIVNIGVKVALYIKFFFSFFCYYKQSATSYHSGTY